MIKWRYTLWSASEDELSEAVIILGKTKMRNDTPDKEITSPAMDKSDGGLRIHTSFFISQPSDFVHGIPLSKPWWCWELMSTSSWEATLMVISPLFESIKPPCLFRGGIPKRWKWAQWQAPFLLEPNRAIQNCRPASYSLTERQHPTINPGKAHLIYQNHFWQRWKHLSDASSRSSHQYT